MTFDERVHRTIFTKGGLTKDGSTIHLFLHVNIVFKITTSTKPPYQVDFVCFGKNKGTSSLCLTRQSCKITPPTLVRGTDNFIFVIKPKVMTC